MNAYACLIYIDHISVGMLDKCSLMVLEIGSFLLTHRRKVLVRHCFFCRQSFLHMSLASVGSMMDRDAHLMIVS